MNILRYFRLVDSDYIRYGSYKVDEIEALLEANGGIRTKVPDASEYLYQWDCKGYRVFVHYRYGSRGLPYAYYGYQ